MLRLHTLLVSITLLVCTASTTAQRRPLADTENCKLFTLESKLLSAFWGRSVSIEAGVVLPPGYTADKSLPVAYNIHGFGGTHSGAWRREKNLVAGVSSGELPLMIYVFLNAACPLGHHEFADSVNNGPWGEALTSEFIPALEKEFGAFSAPRGRFLTGHSSGGWSSFWLQVTYPEFFNGTWSTAPDSLDFRDFTGIDIYDFDNVYMDPQGEEIMLMRRNGEFTTSIRSFVEREFKQQAYGGQFASFNAVFSPRGEDGRPMMIFDLETGEIDPFVAEAWKKYDVSLLLREKWPEIGKSLEGKLHCYCGDIDTFRLEGPFKLLADELELLGSDAEFILVPGRDHSSVAAPSDEFWPKGMMHRIHWEMAERFAAGS